MEDGATQRAIEAVWKMESARVIAGLARSLRGDVALAEDAAQEALLAALKQWPGEGIPENPGAWLAATARRRAIDAMRRERRFAGVRVELTRELEARQGGVSAAGPAQAQVRADRLIDGEVEDDLLRLVFTACHPALPRDARSALTLRLLCGVTTGEIARAFLMPEPTISQRLVRAKRLLVVQRVPFEVPVGAEMGERLSSVLEVIYLLFNEGYSATAGDDWMRPSLCEEALRLGRILCELMGREGEVQGLVALMEIQSSRISARVDAEGNPILVLEQNRELWDQLLIRRGLAALAVAEGMGAERGPYVLQASIAAFHARARRAEETDWRRIAELYGELVRVMPSPIVELNRGVAVGMAEGPGAGLAIVDRLVGLPALRGYHLLPSVRGDLLMKLGRMAEAREEFERAAEMTRNDRERGMLLARARECKS